MRKLFLIAVVVLVFASWYLAHEAVDAVKTFNDERVATINEG